MLGSGIPDKMAAIFVFATHTSCLSFSSLLISLSVLFEFRFQLPLLPSFLPLEGTCINSINSISCSILDDTLRFPDDVERKMNYFFSFFIIIFIFKKNILSCNNLLERERYQGVLWLGVTRYAGNRNRDRCLFWLRWHGIVCTCMLAD